MSGPAAPCPDGFLPYLSAIGETQKLDGATALKEPCPQGIGHRHRPALKVRMRSIGAALLISVSIAARAIITQLRAPVCAK